MLVVVPPPHKCLCKFIAGEARMVDAWGKLYGVYLACVDCAAVNVLMVDEGAEIVRAGDRLVSLSEFACRACKRRQFVAAGNLVVN